MQVTGVATCHCQLKLKLSLQPSRAEPSRAERPINSCAQLSHLSTQSISHNGNSRQRRLIDRAGIQSRLPFPHPASPRSATGATIQSRSSIRSILLTDIAFHSMAFQFFTSVQSSSPTAPGPAPCAIPEDGTEAALVLLNSSYPIPLPLAYPLAARYQHCALSTKMPTKHKIYLRGQCGDGVTRGWTKHLYDSVSNSELRTQDYVSISQLTPAVSPLPLSSLRHCADPPSIIICP